ncbi:MAG TPA: ADP-forming succinate--CoA ligase subunit beta [Bacteroidales bacterium]|nr:ADP-forming succinate--CoA ligase subunit beta [Bacteroidales bacterium]
MNLHEYQAKSILRHYGVQVAEGQVAFTTEEAVTVARKMHEITGTNQWVVKAQIHAGGRGKGGGVKLARNLEEVRQHADAILGMQLVTPQTGAKGKMVRKVLIQQDIYYEGASPVSEIYMSILMDRQKGKNMFIYSPKGGMDIEKVAEISPEFIFKEEVDTCGGLQPFQSRKIAFNLGLTGNAFTEMIRFSQGLYAAYIASDALLYEINPVVKTSDNRIFAADAKAVIDSNALYRHPAIADMRDFDEEDPVEIEAGKHDLNYVKLNGNVGCMVNGAGLAMATMDMIKLSGGDPANFLDVGGSANAKRVEEGFRIIMKDPNVKAILVNIFGGIVRCDRVAQGIIDACRNIGEIKIPVIVRLQGTNAEAARKLIDSSGLTVQSASTLQEAASKVKAAVN